MESKIITNAELCELTDNESIDHKLKSKAELLLNAITDWPTYNLKEPSEFIVELKQEIGKNLTFKSIESYYKNLIPEYDAWKMESLSSLLKIFEKKQMKLWMI